MSERDRFEIQVEDAIFDLLASMGISPRLQGFRAIVYCVVELILRPSPADNAMQIYEKAADVMGTSWNGADRAIRYAIEKAYAAVGREKVDEMIGSVPSYAKIDASVFVRLCAKKVRRQVYGNLQ